LVVEISSLPDISQAEMDFLDASFFKPDGASPLPRLPTPAEMLQQYPNNLEGAVLKYESLNLAVKVGQVSCVKLEEAQAMIAIRQLFPSGEVPVPEVFGWRWQDDTNHIYMSLVPGEMLGRAWPSLTEAEKVSIYGELSQIVTALRHVKQSMSLRSSPRTSATGSTYRTDPVH
jgi:hypothetical protein